MKKIFLSLLLFASAIVLASGNTYAAVDPNVDDVYRFVDINQTVNGITLDVDQDSQVWTINGTATSVFNLADAVPVFQTNALGDSLDVTKSYYVVYEYISGTYTAHNGSNIRPLLNTKILDATHTFTETTLASNRVALVIPKNTMISTDAFSINLNGSGTAFPTFDNLKFKLNFYELDSVSDFDFFSSTDNQTINGVSAIVSNGNQLVLDGAVTIADSIYSIDSVINSTEIELTSTYIVKYQYISGSLSGTSSSGFAFNYLYLPGEKVLKHSSHSLDGAILLTGNQVLDMDILVHGVSPQTLTYDNLTIQYSIELYGTPEAEPNPSIQLFDNHTATSNGVSLSITEGNLIVLNGTASGPAMFTGLKDLMITENGKNYRFTYEYVSGTSTGVVTALSVNGASYQIVLSTENYQEATTQITVPWSESITAVGISAAAGGTYTNLTYRIIIEELASELYTVTFDTQGGTAVSSQIVPSGENAVIPTAPSKPGYNFMYWRDSLEVTPPFDFITPITGDITLYAVWESNGNEIYTVTFDSNGGSAISDVIVEEGQLIESPATPTRTGYTFGGWFSDEGLTTMFDFEVDLITADTTLYAKWLPVSGGGTQLPADETNSMTYVWIGLGAVLIVVALGASSSKKKGSKGKRR